MAEATKYISTHTGTEIDQAIDKVGSHTSSIDTLSKTLNSLSSEVKSLSAKLASESSTREANDNNEATARKKADTTLQSNIDAEATERESSDSIIETTAELARDYPAPRFDGFVAGVTVVLGSTANPDRIVYDTEAKAFYAAKSATSGSAINLKFTYYENWDTRMVYKTADGVSTSKVFIGPVEGELLTTGIYIYDASSGLVLIGYTDMQSSIEGMLSQQTVGLTDTTAGVNDTTAKNWFKNIFNNQTGDDSVSCVAARILDLDRDHRMAVVRYTISTDTNDIAVYMGSVCISACRASGTDGTTCVTVNIPYDKTGSPDMYNGKYTLKQV